MNAKLIQEKGRADDGSAGFPAMLQRCKLDSPLQTGFFVACSGVIDFKISR